MSPAPRRATLAGARRWVRVPAFDGWGPDSRLRRYLPVLAVAALTLIVVAGLAVVPLRTYWRQRTQMRSAEAELQQLQDEVSQLDARLQQLRTDDEVERIAREQYDLVFPGEESFRILPAPDPDATPPADGEGDGAPTGQQPAAGEQTDVPAGPEQPSTAGEGAGDQPEG